MSLVNLTNQYALVTNAFQVHSHQDFLEFPGTQLGLEEELILPANPVEGEDWAEVALWRRDSSPALPRLNDRDSLLSLLPRHLRTGHALILAVVAPGQALDDAAALLLGFDGGIWLGKASALRNAPGPYLVQPFHAQSLKYGAFKP